jgi:hypothetical protein
MNSDKMHQFYASLTKVTKLWGRLTLCYALAAYKDESPDAPLQFRFRKDCQEPFDRREDIIFPHVSIPRGVHQLGDRINQCYVDSAYSGKKIFTKQINI